MNFEKAKNSYKKNAFVQKEMAKNLIRLLDLKKFDTILEIGAGTGFLTDEIIKNIQFNKIFLNDLSENFTNFIPDEYLKGDILEIKIPSNLDLIISNAAFQWIFDYEKLFLKLKGALKMGSILAFTTFGAKNFIQIKDITGCGLNYPDLSPVIERAGFRILNFEQELKTLYFSDIKDVLNHIKFTGVKIENRFWTKKDFFSFNINYREKFQDSSGFELTYHPVYYVLKAI